METPKLDSETQTPQTLSPSNSGRRRSTDPNSPEFEFWMVRNPSFPQAHLLSADELFNNGVLLPLDALSQIPDSTDPDPKLNSVTPNPEPEPDLDPEPGPGPESSTGPSASKRWRDIFKKGEKKSVQNSEDKERNRDKEKKKDRKIGNNSGGVSNGAAELNINIWPFSRSHSAGIGGNRPKLGVGSVSRKVSSAPCSRSNSAGESKSRKWPNSPGRGGIHLGRNSPVWQARRGGPGLRCSETVVRNTEKAARKEGLESRKVKNGNSNGGGGNNTGNSRGGGGKGGVLNLNVPMCIGYRQQLSCRSDEGTLLRGGESGSGGGGGADNNGGGGKLFNLRTLFTKKVY